MTRSIKVALIIAVIAAVATMMMLSRLVTRSDRASAAVSVSGAAQQALSNSVDYVRDRVTGGVGVAVTIDSSTKLPMVGAVAIGSPANEAGLHAGDIITKAGGIATTGLVLKQVVDNLRGITGMSVPVTVLRGTNYIDFNINRTSMKNLKTKSFNPFE